MIPVAYIPAVRDALKDLRVSLAAAGLPDAAVRDAIYNWIVRSADRFLPGDANAAKQWVDAALQELAGAAAGGGHTPPPVVPAVTLAWEQRLKRAMLFFSAPNYYWPNVAAGKVPEILDAILAAGLDGPSVEFGGMFIADEYNKIPQNAAVDAIYKLRLDQWAVWEEALRVRGLVAHIAFLNSNQSFANKISDAAWTNIAAEFKARYGTRNKIVLALSEDDGRTRASIRRAITTGLAFPAEQTITHDGKGGTICEEHHSRMRIVTGRGHRFLNVTDNADAIGDLYGSEWRNGGAPILGNIEDFARRIRAGGVSGAVYSFSKVFDTQGLAAAAKGWRGQQPGSQAGTDALDIRGATLLSKHRNHKIAELPIVHALTGATTGTSTMEYQGSPRNWPVTEGIDSRCYIFWSEAGRVFGGHFEWKKPDGDRRELKNIFGGYLDGRVPPSGTPVFYLLANNGNMKGTPTARTNVVAGGRFP